MAGYHGTEAEKKWARERYHRLIASGICPKCSVSPLVPGRSLCQSCATKQKERKKIYRERLIREKVCISCHRPNDNAENSGECKECAAKRAEKTRMRDQKRIQRKHCVRCNCINDQWGQNPRLCSLCVRNQREYSKKKYQKHWYEGKCVHCGVLKNEEEKNKKFCRNCYQKLKKYRQAHTRQSQGRRVSLST